MTPRSLWLLSSPAFPIALQRSRDRTQREPLGWPLAPHRKHPTIRQKHKVRTTTEMEIASKSNRYLEKDEGNVTKGISKAEEGSAEALCYRSRFHRRPLPRQSGLMGTLVQPGLHIKESLEQITPRNWSIAGTALQTTPLCLRNE